MTITPAVEAFWQRYLSSRFPSGPHDARPAVVTDFGDSKEMADELGRLIQAGIKSATSGLAWDFAHGDEAPPTVGDLEVVVDGSGHPLCIIEITEVVARPFNAIDAAFAFDYGEGDRTLTWWRREMWEYFATACRQAGREPSQDMSVICMRFRLVYTEPLTPIPG